jgi:hypothetical protein
MKVIMIVPDVGFKENIDIISHRLVIFSSHNVVHLASAGFELTTLVVVGTDCIGSCKSNYHTIKPTVINI